jgi:hypothetical protein
VEELYALTAMFQDKGVHTVSNNRSVDYEGQESHLIRGSVVLQQCSSIVVTNRHVGGTLGNSRANSGSDRDSLEKHSKYKVVLEWTVGLISGWQYNKVLKCDEERR